ncbi:extracellular solute-binding protein [Mucilaginibacter mali]|uniref:Extracellular solute-binding protein n=1 Tax=Mucilaginibacter mali TaxID=2740462 RepID=A0A7D4QP69_9SPHI|nr:extracellular solute-binding protein [Mucilaginibacter mali]QKJ28349.1 extracellular solute-binding protein [Mucilaginibacter mali]
MSFQKDYEAKHPDVKLDFKPNSFDDAFNKANQDFANGTGLYDIVMQYNFSLASFVTNDYVYPIDELIKNVPDSLKSFEKDMFPRAWHEVGFYKNLKDPQGPIVKVGYPFTSNTMFLCYNKAMFDDKAAQTAYEAKYKEKLQVPATWEQYQHVAAFFTRPDKHTYGVCLQGAVGSWLYYEWVNFLFGMGGKVMDKEYGWQGDQNTKVLLNTPEALNATKFYYGLKPYNAGNFTNVDAYEQIKLVKQGNIAMALIWSDLAYSLTAKPDGSFDTRFGFAPIPGNKSLLAGGSFFINRKSKNPEVAARYIIDQMQPKVQVALFKKGLCSPLKTVYDDPEVKKIPYAEALRSSLDRGVYMLEAGIDATMISDKITAALQKMWNNELTPEQAVKIMQTDIDKERKVIYANAAKH